jgi:hypothetical protein
MTVLRNLAAALLGLAVLAVSPPADPVRQMLPLPGPRFSPPDSGVIFSDDFSHGLEAWQPDRDGVWSVRHGLLRADLPDRKQERSFLYAGDSSWTDYTLAFDVCGIRGVDKGGVVRIEGEQGIAADLRGPGYHDLLLQRNQWPLGRAKVVNANGVWHHVQIEAHGHRYRVWVDGALVLDRQDGHHARPRGRIALAAYTGGVGECTVYYDNVVVTRTR